jgi:hypothetical protein
MANIRVKKTVYNKNEFEKVVDTSFNTFTDDIEEQDKDTVEELFRLYDKLFYEIPTEGTKNSHTFILQESSKLVEFTKDTEEIQPLLDEIATLREQLLISNQANQDIQQDFFNNVQP